MAVEQTRLHQFFSEHAMMRVPDVFGPDDKVVGMQQHGSPDAGYRPTPCDSRCSHDHDRAARKAERAAKRKERERRRRNRQQNAAKSAQQPHDEVNEMVERQRRSRKEERQLHKNSRQLSQQRAGSKGGKEGIGCHEPEETLQAASQKIGPHDEFAGTKTTDLEQTAHAEIATDSAETRQRLSEPAPQHQAGSPITAPNQSAGSSTYPLTPAPSTNDPQAAVLVDLLRNRLAYHEATRARGRQDTEAAFAAVDPEGSGFVSYGAFKQAMTTLDLNLSDYHIVELLKMWDPTGQGFIRYRPVVSRLHAPDDPATRREFCESPHSASILHDAHSLGSSRKVPATQHGNLEQPQTAAALSAPSEKKPGNLELGLGMTLHDLNGQTRMVRTDDADLQLLFSILERESTSRQALQSKVAQMQRELYRQKRQIEAMDFDRQQLEIDRWVAQHSPHRLHRSRDNAKPKRKDSGKRTQERAEAECGDATQELGYNSDDKAPGRAAELRLRLEAAGRSLQQHNHAASSQGQHLGSSSVGSRRRTQAKLKKKLRQTRSERFYGADETASRKNAGKRSESERLQNLERELEAAMAKNERLEDALRAERQSIRPVTIHPHPKSESVVHRETVHSVLAQLAAEEKAEDSAMNAVATACRPGDGDLISSRHDKSITPDSSEFATNAAAAVVELSEEAAVRKIGSHFGVPPNLCSCQPGRVLRAAAAALDLGETEESAELHLASLAAKIFAALKWTETITTTARGDGAGSDGHLSSDRAAHGEGKVAASGTMQQLQLDITPPPPAPPAELFLAPEMFDPPSPPGVVSPRRASLDRLPPPPPFAGAISTPDNAIENRRPEQRDAILVPTSVQPTINETYAHVGRDFPSGKSLDPATAHAFASVVESKTEEDPVPTTVQRGGAQAGKAAKGKPALPPPPVLGRKTGQEINRSFVPPPPTKNSIPLESGGLPPTPITAPPISSNLPQTTALPLVGPPLVPSLPTVGSGRSALLDSINARRTEPTETGVSTDAEQTVAVRSGKGKGASKGAKGGSKGKTGKPVPPPPRLTVSAESGVDDYRTGDAQTSGLPSVDIFGAIASKRVEASESEDDYQE